MFQLQAIPHEVEEHPRHYIEVYEVIKQDT